MRSRYTVRETERAHFVTSTIVEWLPLFILPSCCDILVQSLGFCQREKGLRLYAWVIMDYHFHAVVQCEELARVMADLKKFPLLVPNLQIGNALVFESLIWKPWAPEESPDRL